MNDVQTSYNYTEGLLNSQQAKAEAHHGRVVGDVLTGVVVASGAHWWGNRQRKRLGMVPEPMNKWAGAGVAAALGYVFWFLPFLVYMLLEIYVVHSVIPAVILTGALFIGGWILFKKRRARKYNEYYANLKPKVMRAEDYHAPLSDDWLSSTGDRVRKNLSGH